MQPSLARAMLRADADLADDADGYSAARLADDLRLSQAQIGDLHRFRDLLVAANAQMNLVGPSALSQFWRRHVLDSGQLLDLAPGALIWADLGAGAGFPGVVLGIRLKGQVGAMVHLVESQAKRCRFLQAVAEALALPVRVHWARAERLDNAPAVDIVTARACAPLARLFDYALPFMRHGAPGLFLKGRSAASEVDEARRTWRFEATLLPSRSGSASDAESADEAAGWIVSVEGLARG